MRTFLSLPKHASRSYRLPHRGQEPGHQRFVALQRRKIWRYPQGLHFHFTSCPWIHFRGEPVLHYSATTSTESCKDGHPNPPRPRCSVLMHLCSSAITTSFVGYKCRSVATKRMHKPQCIMGERHRLTRGVGNDAPNDAPRAHVPQVHMRRTPPASNSTPTIFLCQCRQYWRGGT